MRRRNRHDPNAYEMDLFDVLTLQAEEQKAALEDQAASAPIESPAVNTAEEDSEQIEVSPPASSVDEPTSEETKSSSVEDAPQPVTPSLPAVTFDPTLRPAPPATPRERVQANIDAIEVLRTLQREDRFATPEEQVILAGYTSWGAASQVFDRGNTSMADLRSKLESIVDQREYAALAETTLTAFFTPDEVIAPVWEAVQTAGYTGGPVLEPGCGTGNFIGAAPNSAEVVGIEVDPIASQIAHYLYPEAQIVTEKFEKTRLDYDSFSLAIGNVPFGNFRLHDPEHNPNNHTIHNHFIVKALNAVRPGGYVAVVTSSSTSDAQKSLARKDMIDRADLVSATRLPVSTFENNAGTTVSADLLIFRVREEDREPTEQSLRFIQTDEYSLDDESIARVNGVFADHPERVVGTPRVVRDRFGKPVLQGAPVPGEELSASLRRLVQTDMLTALNNHLGLSPQPASEQAPVQVRVESAADQQIPGTVRYTQNGDELTFARLKAKGKWDEIVPPRGTSASEWKALLDLRDTSRQLREAYREGTPGVESLRQQLATQYDDYVATYGPLNRFVLVKPRKPTQKQQAQRYKQLVTQWRRDNDLGHTEEPTPEVEAELRQQAALPTKRPKEVKKHIGVLQTDPFIQQMTAIEHYDRDHGTAEKTVIFFDNPARPTLHVDHVDTLEEGVEVSLDEHGVIDPRRVSEVTRLDQEIVEEELIDKKIAFRNPENPDAFIRAEHYLSGVVEDKLIIAQEAAMRDERFKANVDALTEVLPERVETGIIIQPGVTWISEEYYKQFAHHAFGVDPNKIDFHPPSIGREQWRVEVKNDPVMKWKEDADLKYGVIAANNITRRQPNYQSSNPKAAEEYNQGLATTRHDGEVVSAITMLQAVMNQDSPTINYSQDWRKENNLSTGVCSEATQFASRKADQLREEFTKWIMDDPSRRNEILDAYNRHYNSYVAAKWDGSYRSMPGLSDNFTPYSYQLNAVERMVNEPGVLLNHAVGAGKTGTFLMGAAELKRLGKVKQPWIVVPNHLCEQIAADANRWYPGAKVLSAAGLSTPEERRNFVAQTTTEDWDFVVVPRSVFERIPVSSEMQADYLDRERSQAEEALVEAQIAGDPDSKTTKQIQRYLKILDDRRLKLLDSPRDAGMCFEDTPCDYLIIDEAHEYKNLARFSTIDDINSSGSQRASDLEMKMQYLRDQKNGLHQPVATFATGTPIANNLAEIWVMMRFLRPDILDHAAMPTVQGFAASFVKRREEVEVRASGVGLRSVSRTVGFNNVGQLVGLCEPFMDVVTGDQIEAQRPSNETVSVEFDIDQQSKDFIADFVYRETNPWASQFPEEAQAIDNALKIQSDGLKVSIDPRLVNLDYEGYSPRVTAVADTVARVWQDTKDNEYLRDDGTPHPRKGGLQIIFLDRGTPKADGSYSVYNEIRRACADRGMDPSRIAYVHEFDDDRAELFRRCREGEIDVIIGSTEKLGTGANIQTRAVALHNVDVPWRPADLEQRIGRIERQGNQNAQVQTFNYIARGTTDAVRWQTVHRKARFINQFMSADRSLRQMDSLESSTEDAAAHNKAVATGDPRHITLANLDKEVKNLEVAHQEWVSAVEGRQFGIKAQEAELAKQRSLVRWAKAHKEPCEEWENAEQREWTPPIGGTTTDRAKAARFCYFAALRVLNNKYEYMRPERGGAPRRDELATIGGVTFTIGYSVVKQCLTIYPEGVDPKVLPKNWVIDMDPLYFTDTGNPLHREGATDKEYGLLTRLENKVTSMGKMISVAEEAKQLAADKLDKLRSEAPPEFTQQDELKEKRAQREVLREEIRQTNQSERQQKILKARAARNELHGRKPGWSLRLNPTTQYAALVEKRTVEGTIKQAKIDEVDALCLHGAIGPMEHARAHEAIRHGESYLQQLKKPAPTPRTPRGAATGGILKTLGMDKPVKIQRQAPKENRNSRRQKNSPGWEQHRGNGPELGM
ncbi:DEAD/DEAH box helicase family protein [Corynebacterium uropygiale]|uniref:DEAD/DEAH box helicase family protein n=1 Tax=Corynebacterium uropygiale TaxID=1775911 RepID=A0A9X1TYS0_9CORY|nr:helicase-related protein [Corynebacterium uropygiale]MCF4006141.1 DEAD/DEAH box helicase family protein [Corynebacterium uropygiale]